MITVAIPSLDDRGLDSQVSGHFGRAPYFTVVKIEAGQVKEVKVLSNNAREGFHHEDLFSAFSREGVELIIAGGIGGGAVAHFEERGIDVLPGASGRVGDVVQAYIKGTLVANRSVIEWDRGHHHHH